MNLTRLNKDINVTWNGEQRTIRFAKLVDKIIQLNDQGRFDGLELHIDIKEPRDGRTSFPMEEVW